MVALVALVAALGLLAVAPSVASAAPQKFTLDISPRAGGVGDTYSATVLLELDGVTGPDRYWHPDFGDFEVLSTQVKQGTSSVIDAARGQRVRTTVVRRYDLRPTRSGRLRVRPARVRIGREEFETKEAWVQVGPSTSQQIPGVPDGTAPSAGDPTALSGDGVPGFSPPSAKLRNQDMFLHVVADKRDPYVGEQVTVTWMLYTRTEVLKFEPRPPSLGGLWAEILYEPDAYFTYSEDLVGGVPYMVAVVSKRAVFPTSSGRVTIQPFRARVAALSTALGRLRELEAPEVTLQVRPLPDGAPPGFDPTYVGRFEVASSVNRNQIAASESLTLTVKVTGEGAIRRTRAPKLEANGFAFRAPRDTQDTHSVSGAKVTGERSYRYWTTPTRGGELTIPAITIPFFDPKTERYEVAKSTPIPVLVSGDPSKLASATAGSTRENVVPRDIRLIHDGAEISSRTVPLLHRSGWFWLLAGIPPLAFLALVVVDRARQRLNRDTPRARLRRARGRARKRFRVAEIHVRGNRPAKFYGELARVLYDHIEERIGQPVQSMTREELRSFLADKGFGDTTIRQIDHSFESFDFARFAPTAQSPEEMRASLSKLQELLRRIEKTRLKGEAGREAA